MERLTEYNKLAVGDLVRIRGERGTFEVMYVDAFDSERPAEVTVVGGSSGRKAWRTFTENRVTRRPRRQQVTR
jgi:hypothetical protein